MKRFRVQDALWCLDTVSIALMYQDGKERKVATEVAYSSQPFDGTIISPFLSLTREEAQELANQLYAVGIQPSQAKGSSGQLAAVSYHLEDMRKLVFK